ncbi:hypothetical protein EYF80_007033 [Liparis tanakae]|uniref:Uncharacterized protein n=1 Tax=Liparis tanakae TaxID=230148 RepID=A0A4Z2IZS4_9TELE|nr:hypothetical protein EYF80_007033 [Liparis tanakae]
MDDQLHSEASFTDHASSPASSAASAIHDPRGPRHPSSANSEVAFQQPTLPFHPPQIPILASATPLFIPLELPSSAFTTPLATSCHHFNGVYKSLFASAQSPNRRTQPKNATEERNRRTQPKNAKPPRLRRLWLRRGPTGAQGRSNTVPLRCSQTKVAGVVLPEFGVPLRPSVIAVFFFTQLSGKSTLSHTGDFREAGGLFVRHLDFGTGLQVPLQATGYYAVKLLFSQSDMHKRWREGEKEETRVEEEIVERRVTAAYGEEAPAVYCNFSTTIYLGTFPERKVLPASKNKGEKPGSNKHSRDENNEEAENEDRQWDSPSPTCFPHVRALCDEVIPTWQGWGGA